MHGAASFPSRFYPFDALYPPILPSALAVKHLRSLAYRRNGRFLWPKGRGPIEVARTGRGSRSSWRPPRPHFGHHAKMPTNIRIREVHLAPVGSQQPTKVPVRFPNCIAAFAVRRVRSGRLLAGNTTGDVLSPVAQKRNGFEVHSLDDESCRPDTGWKAAVTMDSKNFTPADAVAFRLDFACWLGMLRQRDRRIVEALAVGERTGKVARRYRVTPSRISHLRREFQESWERFVDEIPEAQSAVAAT